ncbi:MAG: hypothetical protein ACI8QC_000851 [Planctomycetota bacterium]|jgi:hypothetical protein
MKKLVFGAAALTLASSAFASDTDWSAFDQDVEALATSLAADHDGPSVGGYLQTIYVNNSDNDISGFDTMRARIAITGGRGGYTYKMMVDASDGSDANSGIIRDAYVNIPVSTVSSRFGRFKPAVSRNGLTSSSKLFFTARGPIGDSFDGRQDGVGLYGDFDQLSWALSITNGFDGLTDDYLVALRVSLDLMGEGVGNVEGAYNAGDEIGATASLATFDDGGVTDGDGTVLEVHAVSSVYSFGIEFGDIGDGGSGATTSATVLANDSSPLTFSTTYMVVPDAWEVGLRYSDLDDDGGVGDSTTITDIAVNHYLDGHNLKWGFGFTSLDFDNDALDTDTLSIQLTMVF